MVEKWKMNTARSIELIAETLPKLVDEVGELNESLQTVLERQDELEDRQEELQKQIGAVAQSSERRGARLSDRINNIEDDVVVLKDAVDPNPRPMPDEDDQSLDEFEGDPDE